MESIDEVDTVTDASFSSHDQTVLDASKCYLCAYCSKSFNHPGNRTRHQKTVCKKRPLGETPQNVRSIYVCIKNVCDKTFVRKLNRDRHSLICSVSSQKNYKICFICKKEFSRTTHLRRHLATHSNNKQKKIKCPSCLSSFTCQDKYDFHLPKCHPSMINTFPEETLDRTHIHLLQDTSDEFTGISPIGDKIAVDSSCESASQDVSRVEHFSLVDVLPDQVDSLASVDYSEPDVQHSPSSLDASHTVYIILEETDLNFDFTNCNNDSNNLDGENESSMFDYDSNYLVAKRVKYYISNLVHRAKYSNKKKTKLAKFLTDLFGDNLKDIQFSQWLCKEYKISDLTEILEWHGSKQGRPVKITKDTKIKVQDFWRENSIIRVDRRNMRHFVRVAAKNVPKIASELLDHDAKVTKVTAKRGWKYQADRYVTTKTY